MSNKYELEQLGDVYWGVRQNEQTPKEDRPEFVKTGSRVECTTYINEHNTKGAAKRY